MLKQISQILELSTIHAIPNIIRSNNLVLKFLWLFCFIGSSSVCAWFIFNNISKYFQYDVVSKIDIKYETSLIFPVVSICDLNPLTTNESKNYYKQIYRTEYPDFIYLDELMVRLKSNSTNQHLYGKNLIDYIVSCEFLSSQCNLDQDFDSYFDINYGNCIRFNSGTNFKGEKVKQKFVSNTGVWNSLDLEIFIGSSIQNTNIFSKKNGLNILISNSSTDSLYGEGINISPGTSTNVFLNKYSIVKQPYPYSECINDLTSISSHDSECFKKLITFKSTYIYDDCVRMCYQKLLSNNCKCQSAIYGYVYNDSLRKCLLDKSQDKNDSKCMYDNWEKLTKNSSILKECNCPFECEFNGYQYTTSFSEFPTKYYFDFLINKSSFIKKKYSNISYEELKRSVAKIQIFYDDLKQTIVSQEVKIDLGDMVSNIGGTLGLFLGNLFDIYHLKASLIE